MMSSSTAHHHTTHSTTTKYIRNNRTVHEWAAAFLLSIQESCRIFRGTLSHLYTTRVIYSHTLSFNVVTFNMFKLKNEEDYEIIIKSL